MSLRLRQIALVANKLEPVIEDLRAVLGIEVCYRDPGVKRFGLENALLPIGNQLLEVVAPIEENTAGGRYLERRGGDGGYMVITQTTDEHAGRKKHVQDLGIRLVSDFAGHEFINMQMHPKDTGGSFFEIDQQLGEGANDPDGPWDPAGGEGWKAFKRTDRVSAIVAAELQCEDYNKVAERWSEIAQIPLTKGPRGATQIELDDAAIRFVAISDRRPEGLGGIDVKTEDRAAVLAAAKERGLKRTDNEIGICGMRIRLV